MQDIKFLWFEISYTAETTQEALWNTVNSPVKPLTTTLVEMINAKQKNSFMSTSGACFSLKRHGIETFCSQIPADSLQYHYFTCVLSRIL